MARERHGHTLQATALVNEAFIRLIDTGNVAWNDRAHFLGIAAQVDAARADRSRAARGMQKRGAGAYMLPLEEGMAVVAAPAVDLIALDAALDALSRDRRAQEPRDRDAILWRHDRRGDRRSPSRIHRHREARLARGEVVAKKPRDEWFGRPALIYGHGDQLPLAIIRARCRGIGQFPAVACPERRPIVADARQLVFPSGGEVVDVDVPSRVVRRPRTQSASRRATRSELV